MRSLCLIYAVHTSPSFFFGLPSLSLPALVRACAALRVTSIGLLNSGFWDVLRSTGTDFPQSLPRQLALVMLMARVPTFWAAGFCFRLVHPLAINSFLMHSSD